MSSGYTFDEWPEQPVSTPSEQLVPTPSEQTVPTSSERTTPCPRTTWITIVKNENQRTVSNTRNCFNQFKVSMGQMHSNFQHSLSLRSQNDPKHVEELKKIYKVYVDRLNERHKYHMTFLYQAFMESKNTLINSTAKKECGAVAIRDNSHHLATFVFEYSEIHNACMAQMSKFMHTSQPQA